MEIVGIRIMLAVMLPFLEKNTQAHPCALEILLSKMVILIKMKKQDAFPTDVLVRIFWK